MSKIVAYGEIVAFSPGYYIAEIIEDMGISQAEFATRLGITTETLSFLLDGQESISYDLAEKLYAMMGTSVAFWLNLQSAYDQKLIEMKKFKRGKIR